MNTITLLLTLLCSIITTQSKSRSLLKQKRQSNTLDHKASRRLLAMHGEQQFSVPGQNVTFQEKEESDYVKGLQKLHLEETGKTHDEAQNNFFKSDAVRELTDQRMKFEDEMKKQEKWSEDERGRYLAQMGKKSYDDTDIQRRKCVHARDQMDERRGMSDGEKAAHFFQEHKEKTPPSY